MTSGESASLGRMKVPGELKSLIITLEVAAMDESAPIHPGDHLAEILDELDISQYRLATAIGVSARRINEIVHGNRSVSADTALRIGKALRMTPDFWLNLQKLYDLEKARGSTDVSQIEPLVPEPAGIPTSDPSD